MTISTFRYSFLILLLSQLVFCASMTADATLDSAGSATLTVSAEYPGMEGKDVYLNVSGIPSSVTVKDKTGLIIDHEAESFGNYTLIHANVPLDYLQFEVVSDSYTKKEGPDWNFELVMGSSVNLSSFSASLALPRGAVLKSTNGDVSDSGSSLLVSWSAPSVDNKHNVRLKAGYELAGTGGDYTLLFVAGGIIAILALFYFVRKKPIPPAAPPAQAPPEIESSKVFLTLDEVDKEIIREIHRNKGKTTQATLYLNTHIAKATLSRRLASLESRGIIQKSQKGNRNLITLTDMLSQ
ncbi:MAG TPA: winged helix-turn-helix transcriptional regulator [Candidatus Bilamarchaeum sp.]|nr:winged helix-turn-helix transcriptional regulator [Candidatus Bilamarchaeum sp.]